MNIVVNKNVVMRIDSFVSILKTNFHFKEKELLSQKNKMLTFLKNHINKVTQDLNGGTRQEQKYRSGYCYWEDGVSNYRWIFDYRVYYNQNLVIIHQFRWINKFRENKEVKAVFDLMERIEKKYTYGKLGKWTIVKGDEWPTNYEGLRDLGELFNTEMYESNGEAIFVFRLESGGKRFICARMITNENRKGLYLKLLKKKEIPKEILHDIIKRHL